MTLSVDAMAVPVDSKLASINYPRTGKRGVPQQFPRRLFEMLESETKMVESSSGHPKVIFWSDSGKAFRIVDVGIFASTVLPKYFRTKKFSSFQRNLNLYGFSKVRRGPETDMYAHPTFIRNRPEALSQLRKITSTSNRQRHSHSTSSSGSTSSSSVGSQDHHHNHHRLHRGSSEEDRRQQILQASRAVSPSPPRMIPTTVTTTNFYNSPKVTEGIGSVQNIAINNGYSITPHALPSPVCSPIWPSQTMSNCCIANNQPPVSVEKKNDGRGRLDLLALALEREAFL